MIAALSYVVSFVTALGCAILLTRAWRRTRVTLLFWSALCFWGLAFANALVFVDLQLVPQYDLYGIRLAAGLLSVCVLLYGMVWDSR